MTVGLPEGADTTVEGTELFDSLVEQAIAKVTPTDNAGAEFLVDDEPADDTDTTVEAADDNTDTETPADNTELDRLTAREAAIAAKEKDLETRLAEIKRKDLDSQGKLDPNDLRKLAETNPQAVLEKLGLDQEYIMDVLIAEKLGDKAPQALKEKLRDYKLKKEIESIRQERDYERAVAESRNYYEKVSNDAREYVTKALDVKVAPTVSQVVKTDPDLVHSLVLAEIDKDARAKVARGEKDGELLTYAEAVKGIESLFAKVAAAVKNVATETTSKQVAAKTQKTTTPPVTRPKSAKPKSEIDELEEAGWKKAMQTYYKEEAKHKR